VSPDLERLLRPFGEAEVEGPGEILLGSVDPPRREELLGAENPEERALLGADEILPSVAARHGQIGGAHEPA